MATSSNTLTSVLTAFFETTMESFSSAFRCSKQRRSTPFGPSCLSQDRLWTACLHLHLLYDPQCSLLQTCRQVLKRGAKGLYGMHCDACDQHFVAGRHFRKGQAIVDLSAK
jgi:hypothetical protein